MKYKLLRNGCRALVRQQLFLPVEIVIALDVRLSLSACHIVRRRGWMGQREWGCYHAVMSLKLWVMAFGADLLRVMLFHVLLLSCHGISRSYLSASIFGVYCSYLYCHALLIAVLLCI